MQQGGRSVETVTFGEGVAREGKTDLISAIRSALGERARRESVIPRGVVEPALSSAVLCLLGQRSNARSSGTCLVFNKRSLKVKQPGDLCFPGGRISSRLDGFLSRLLRLPFSPLTRWPGWPEWRRERSRETGNLALLLAAALREGLEEMRLNPWGISFLGPLPPQSLRIFRRVIYPMVGWINRQKRFFPNWEVEDILYIPLKDLLDADHYRCYRLRYETPADHPMSGKTQDLPCFVHEAEGKREVLWGATYRIVSEFLGLVFDFRPPELHALPIIHGVLDEHYLRGAG